MKRQSGPFYARALALMLGLAAQACMSSTLVLWQVGDLPGAVMPVDHEVFLEFEGPQAPPPAAPPARAAQAPPDTEIYLAPMTVANGVIELGPPVNITGNPGYDNQPSFTPDGKAILFTSVRGGPSTATDIYKYDIASNQITQVTKTPESKYSPTVTPAGAISVIRVELDEAKTQRLWQFSADGRDPRLVLENVKPVGYHAWVDADTVALYVLGEPATLRIARVKSGAAAIVVTGIGRSLHRVPGTKAVSFVQREPSGEFWIKQIDVASKTIDPLVKAVDGSTDHDMAWMPDGRTILMSAGTRVFSWTRGGGGWTEVFEAAKHDLGAVSRLAVSPAGDAIAIVVAEPKK